MKLWGFLEQGFYRPYALPDASEQCQSTRGRASVCIVYN